jgi:DNA-binding transcriptional MerR regulator
MKIGKVSDRTQIPASCIRYYEKKGLLAPAKRLASGYRDYPLEVFETLLIIKAAQRRGFSLDELRSLLPGPGNHWPSKALLLKALRAKQGQLSQQLAQLKQSQAQLGWLIHTVDRKPSAMPREAHIRQVLSQLKSKGILKVPTTKKKKEPG